MSINESGLRVGNFTSSEIYRLMAMGKRDMTEEELAEHKRLNPKSKKKTIESWPGAAALTYIEECNMERRLGLPLDDEAHSKALAWGKLLEKRVFDLLGIGYKECSQETIVHERYSWWAGSPDGENLESEQKSVAEVKCPYSRKSFCQLVDCIEEGKTGYEIMTAIRDKHNDGEKFYWQCVSNAILTKSNFAELIIYAPYKQELGAIRELAANYDGFDQWKYKFIDSAEDSELPHLIEGKAYRNLNVIRFEVPQADIELLTTRVIEAGKKLIEIK